jgi:ribonucleotide monophosphatase NagD (HAD superfamily)
LTDIKAGRAAGVKQTALLLTGRGRAQVALPEAAALAPLLIYEDLTAALDDLIPNA